MPVNRIQLSKLKHDAVIELYRIDLRPAGFTGVFYFTPVFTPEPSGIAWNGNNYTPTDMISDGWEYNGQGVLPTPTITITNIFGGISALCKQYNDLLGAEATRYRVFKADLGFSRNETITDPDKWFVERKVSEDSLKAQFELASSLDLRGMRLPSRVMVANSCSWLLIGGFMGKYCQYAGAATECDGRLSTCRTLGNQQRYGGFPGLGNTSQG
jgi:lambda family phage minor tail protein L